MEFKFDETTLFEHKNNEFSESNSYLIISKNDEIDDIAMDNVIKIIDESGSEVNCTYDKFVEIFDKEGLAGFIM